MLSEKINSEYFEWLYALVCDDGGSEYTSFRRLLTLLHDIEFIYSIAKDANRAEDGLNMRYRFAYEHAGIRNAEAYLTGPCSVLEMMVALALRCEENIMDDPAMGNRTGEWFWRMMHTMGLNGMTDVYFNKTKAEDIVYRFLERRYEPDGKGGLFRIKNCVRDLRDVEIWYQLCWYLDSIM